MLDRRAFLRAALFVAAAPIIVRAANIMPVRQRFVTIAYDITRVPVRGIYYGPATRLPNGEIAYPGDILLSGTSKLAQLEDSRLVLTDPESVMIYRAYHD